MVAAHHVGASQGAVSSGVLVVQIDGSIREPLRLQAMKRHLGRLREEGLEIVDLGQSTQRGNAIGGRICGGLLTGSRLFEFGKGTMIVEEQPTT